jgi:Holliday junction resolvase
MTNSRAKGARGERELSKVLREYGYDTRRGQQYSGANGDADVVGLPSVHIECKRVEKLNLYKAMYQSIRDARQGEIPVVMHRKDRGNWLVTMELYEWMEMYKKWEEAYSFVETVRKDAE